MVRDKTETFTVTTIGAGQPDYAQPQAVVGTTQALIVKYPETEVSGQKYDDYVEINFGTSQQEYIIGTNANNAKAGSWPSGVLARDIAFYATQDCWIRFNYPDAGPQKIPAGMVPALRFFRRVERFFVVQGTVPGKLYAWIEG
jgi:hypothetical protein